MKKRSTYSRKGLLTEIFRKEAESQNNRKPKCYNDAAMNTYTISRNDGEPIVGTRVHSISEMEVYHFLEPLMERDEAYLYSVSERDDDDEHVSRMNGEEWMLANTIPDENSCPRCGGVMVNDRCECSPGGTL